MVGNRSTKGPSTSESIPESNLTVSAADVDLSNSSVSLEVGRGWTSLTVWVWLHLDGNSSVHLNLTLDTPGGASSHLLTLYTDGADIANLVM